VLLDHTRVRLFDGGIKNGIGRPVVLPPVGVIERYVLVLLRSTQNDPSVIVPLGVVSVVNPEFVML
jgi:hypothetical protein